MKPLWTIGIVALCLSLLMVGCRRRYCGWGHGHHKISEKHANKAVKRISSKLDLTDEQEQKLSKIKDELMSKAVTFKGFRQQVGHELIVQAKSDKVDEAAINKLFDDRQQDIVDMRKLMVTKFAEFHAMLTPEQRKEMIEFMEKHQERCSND